MIYLLDSNSCVGWLRQNQPKLVARILQEPQTNIEICSVVVGELLYGTERATIGQQARNKLRVEQLRKKFVSLPYDDLAAEQYGKVRAYLAKRGTPIGTNDLMIASIALVHGLIVVTHNTSEFSRVPGLTIEDWQ